MLFACHVVRAAEAIIIPDPSRDEAFLYNDWQPNRGTVVAFVDPLCPYCKKAFSKLDQVIDYNLFVYWVPIFGQRSEDIIQSFFRCEQPTARPLLHSLVVAGFTADNEAVACEGDFSVARRAINDEMVASYPINGVPAYFLQGVQVSLAQIQTVPVVPARYINGVAIDWQRYQESKVAQEKPPRSLALIFPEGQNAGLDRQLMELYRPQYVFSLNNWGVVCESSAATACGSEEDVQRARSRQYNEIVELLGVDNRSAEIYLVSAEGRLSRIAAGTSPVAD